MTEEQRAGFRERVEAEAREEVARVLADLERLQFDAHQVRHVLRAMQLPVPAALEAFVAGKPLAEAPLAPPPPQPVVETPTPPGPVAPEPPSEASPESSEPEPEPPTLPEPEPPVAPEPTKHVAFKAPAATRDDLRKMPVVVAQGGSLTARNSTVARRQWEVYCAVNSRPTSIGSEIEMMVMQPQSRVTSYMRDMAEIGLIKRTGRNRHALDRKPGMPGRASVEFAPLVAEAPPILPPVESPAADLPPARPEDKQVEGDATVGSEALARVRDVVVKERDMFSPRLVAEKALVTRDTAIAALRILESRGVVTDESPTPDMPLFAYSPPKDPGAAAKADMARRKAESAQKTGNGGSAPVAGTGKGVKANNPEVQGLIAAAQREGAVVTHAPNGHFEVKLPESLGGKRVLISATPSNARTVMNDRARLRRAGLLKS